MGKVIKTVVGAAIAVVGVVTGNVFLIKLGATVAISGLSEIIAGSPKQPEFEDPGVRLTLTTDPALPRQICYGKAATGGNLIFRDTVGTNNSDLWMVTALAGHEVESVEEVKFGGETTTFSSNNAVGTYNNRWFQYEHLGTDSQTADTNLTAASTKWSSTDRLRGVTNIVNKLIYDQEVFKKGLENVIYTIKGKKVYDPRLDSTNGGSGTHRFATKSTWEWSENPVLCWIDYMRGETQNGVLIWGMGQPTGNFDWPNVVAEANICEEAVTLKAGGTEERYTCNGWISSGNNHEPNIKAILSSCAGTVVWQSGLWRIYVGAARTATYTRTEEHMITGVKYQPKKEYRARTNAIRGLYNDPEAGYQAKDYPPVINSTFVTEDGGQELWGDLNLPMTKSKSTAQRLANIALKSSRMEKVMRTTFHTIGLQDQVMDSVNLTYSRFNLSSQKMVIADWAMRFQEDDNKKIGLVFEETLIETDDTIYSWTAASDEATIPAVVDLLDPDPELLNWDDINKTVIPIGIGFDQGDGVSRLPIIGLETGEARDGDAITYTTAYDGVPTIQWLPSGITTETTLSGDVSVSYNAVDATASGFTASILLKELASTITSRTDTGDVAGGTVDREMEKGTTTPAAAWDDKYKFQFDATVANEQITFSPDPILYLAGSCVVGIYIKTTSGGSFIKYGSIVVAGAAGSNATTTVNNIIKTITVSGVTDFAGVQFGVNIESSSPSGSTVFNIDSVKYETATPPSEADASPTGASPTPFQVFQ